MDGGGTRLYGRQAALDALITHLDDTTNGGGGVVLVAGDGGMGKTALAREIVDRARARSIDARWGTCWDGGEAAYDVWMQTLGPEALADLTRGGDADPTDNARHRSIAFDRVARAVSATAATRPILIVLDDLQWADEGSLTLLAHLAGRLPVLPVMVLGTYRDVEVAAGSKLELLGASVDRIELDGLGSNDVAALLADVFGDEADAATVRDVLKRTGGNPFLVTQMARLLAGSGAEVPSRVLPVGVRDLLRRRLARLSDACFTALGAASVLGTDFDVDIVSELSEMPTSDLLGYLDEATAARVLLWSKDARATRRSFVHALFQQVFYDGLDGATRARLHRRAGELLAGRGHTATAELARHFSAARHLVDDGAAARYTLRAGQEALDRLAWEEATIHFASVIEQPSGPPNPHVEAEAHLGLGDARLRLGDTDGAAACFEAAAAVGRRIEDATVIARAALGFAAGLGSFEVKLFDARQVDVLEEAARTLEADSPYRSMVLARLSVALSFITSEERRLALAEEAADIARRRGDAIALGAALAAGCDVLAGPDHAERRRVDASEIVHLAMSVGDRRLELLGRRHLVVALLELGDFAAADAEIDAYRRTAETIGDPFYSWYATLWSGMRHVCAGRIDEARASAAEVERVGREVSSSNATTLGALLRQWCDMAIGDPSAWVEESEKLLAIDPALLGPNAYPTTAGALALAGRVDEARVILDRLVDDVDGLSRDAEWLSAMAYVSEAAFRLNHPIAGRVAELLRPYEPLFSIGGIGVTIDGSVGRFRALACSAAGDHGTAVRLAEEASERDVKAGVLVGLGARRDLARVLQHRGAPGDAGRAAAIGRDMQAVARRLGLEPLARSTAEVLDLALDDTDDRDVVPARNHAPASAAELEREGDIWRVTFDGTTARVRHTKGMADLAVLLARPDAEVHVRELESLPAHTGPTEDPMLDREAIAAYKERIGELEVDIDEARANADIERASRLEAERDFIVDELSHAIGLGGRSRPHTGDPNERLRKAVSARVRDAIKRIDTVHPPLARHLRNSVRTGFFCSYRPEHPVDWTVRIVD